MIDEQTHVHTDFPCEDQPKELEWYHFFSESSMAAGLSRAEPVKIVVLTNTTHYECSGGRNCGQRSAAVEPIRRDRIAGRTLSEGKQTSSYFDILEPVIVALSTRADTQADNI